MYSCWVGLRTRVAGRLRGCRQSAHRAAHRHGLLRGRGPGPRAALPPRPQHQREWLLLRRPLSARPPRRPHRHGVSATGLLGAHPCRRSRGLRAPGPRRRRCTSSTSKRHATSSSSPSHRPADPPVRRPRSWRCSDRTLMDRRSGPRGDARQGRATGSFAALRAGPLEVASASSSASRARRYRGETWRHGRARGPGVVDLGALSHCSHIRARAGSEGAAGLALPVQGR